jgi:hypothetical protein
MFMPCAGSLHKDDAVQAQSELDTAAQYPPESDEHAQFQLVPKDLLVSKGKNLITLPPHLRQFHTKVLHLC